MKKAQARMKKFRCVECGTGTVVPVARPGRRQRYKMVDLILPAKVKVPTCDHCGAEYLSDLSAAADDSALEPLYRAELRKRAGKAIDRIRPHVPEAELERVLGLSRGYLSRLRAGRRDPSGDLVALLALLAKSPRARIAELRRSWSAAEKGRPAA